jgi:hypothetical protein
MFDLVIYYRMVGGFIGTGSTTLGRLRWALTMGAYMALVSLVHHEGWAQTLIVWAACSVMAFLGRLISHSRFQATASFGNSLGMTLVNLLRMLLILAPYAVADWLNLAGFDYWRLFGAVFCVMSGVGYYVGNKYLNGKDCGIYFRNNHSQWRINPQTIVPTSVPLDPACILDQAAVGGSEWGELITGFGYQAMFIMTLVML